TYIISNTYIGSLDRQVQVHIKDNVIVYSLKNFVDSSLGEKFDMRYHENSIKVGFTLFLFNAHNVSSINAHGVNFLAKLSIAGAEHGAAVAICGLSESNITKALRDGLEDSGILFYPSMKDFFDDKTLLSGSGGGAVSSKKTEHITKQLVEILPLITQTAMHTVEVMTQSKVTKKFLKIQPLTLEKSITMMGVAISFYGDLNGLLVMVFEESLAKKVCKIFLEEGENSRSDLMDALGEFVNIIGGKFVQQLQRKHCKIEIAMPRTFERISEILQHKKDKKGAQVNFTVDGAPLALFLTR
ncbi:MAG: chemotaxis protein CheX, partial [Campylobacteraceae bacterium]|nr:chemotaxis protein CheX [Campylobacteraceae bacterium]